LKVGVTSNGDDRFKDSVLPMLDLEQDLDWICLSKEVGQEKPHPAIFEETMRRAGVSHPEEILHIGDNREVDYDAPRRYFRPLLHGQDAQLG
jgi:HAD superfamily hydrolase (TIGR01549 family)